MRQSIVAPSCDWSNQGWNRGNSLCKNPQKNKLYSDNDIKNKIFNTHNKIKPEKEDTLYQIIFVSA